MQTIEDNDCETNNVDKKSGTDSQQETQCTQKSETSKGDKTNSKEKNKVRDYDPEVAHVPNFDVLDDSVKFTTMFVNPDKNVLSDNMTIQCANEIYQLDEYTKKLFDTPEFKDKKLVSWNDSYPLDGTTPTGKQIYGKAERELTFSDGTVVKIHSILNDDPRPDIEISSYEDGVDKVNLKDGDVKYRDQFVSLGDGYYAKIRNRGVYHHATDSDGQDRSYWQFGEGGQGFDIGSFAGDNSNIRLFKISDRVSGEIMLFKPDGTRLLRKDDPEKYDELFKKMESEANKSLIDYP